MYVVPRCTRRVWLLGRLLSRKLWNNATQRIFLIPVALENTHKCLIIRLLLDFVREVRFLLVHSIDLRRLAPGRLDLTDRESAFEP